MSKELQILSPVDNKVYNKSVGAGETIVDSVRTDEYGAVRWEVILVNASNERAWFTVTVVHNGSQSSAPTAAGEDVGGGAQTPEADVEVKTRFVGWGVQLVVVAPDITWRATVHRVQVVPNAI